MQKENEDVQKSKVLKEENSSQEMTPEADALQEEFSQEAAEENSEMEDFLEDSAVSALQIETPLQDQEETNPVKTEEKSTHERKKDLEEPQYPPIDLEVLLQQYSPKDKIEKIKLHKVLDDLLYGSETSRQNALKNLVELRQVVEPFLVASLKVASPQVAEIILEGLRLIDSQKLSICIANILSSSNPEMRMVALRAAQCLPNEKAQPFLEQGLRDPDTRVKRRVISYLSWQDSSWALAEIMRLCNDPDPEVRWSALEALMVMRPSEAYDSLELILPSLKPVYRHRAMALLKQRGVQNNGSTTQPAFPASGKARKFAESNSYPLTKEAPSQEGDSREAAERVFKKEDVYERVMARKAQAAKSFPNGKGTEAVKEESLPQDANSETDACATRGGPANGEARKVAESRSYPATGGSPSQEEGPQEAGEGGSEEAGLSERGMARKTQTVTSFQNGKQVEVIKKKEEVSTNNPENVLKNIAHKILNKE